MSGLLLNSRVGGPPRQPGTIRLPWLVRSREPDPSDLLAAPRNFHPEMRSSLPQGTPLSRAAAPAAHTLPGDMALVSTDPQAAHIGAPTARIRRSRPACHPVRPHGSGSFGNLPSIIGWEQACAGRPPKGS